MSFKHTDSLFSAELSILNMFYVMDADESFLIQRYSGKRTYICLRMPIKALGWIKTESDWDMKGNAVLLRNNRLL